jgi:hypothetical protein
MKIFVCQLYIETGASFPFSHHFQLLVSDRVTNLVKTTNEFRERYGAVEKVVVNVSAKTSIANVELRGPTRFKKTNSIEYTVFLPYTILQEEVARSSSFEAPICQILVGTADALERLGLDCSRFRLEIDSLLRTIMADARMVRQVP